MIENLQEKTKLFNFANEGVGPDQDFLVLKYQNDVYLNLVQRNQQTKANRLSYAKTKSVLIH